MVEEDPLRGIEDELERFGMLEELCKYSGICSMSAYGTYCGDMGGPEECKYFRDFLRSEHTLWLYYRGQWEDALDD